MLLSNMFNNRLDNLVDSSNKEDVISCCQKKNAISLELPAIGRDKVAGYFALEERIKDIKRDTSDVSFLNYDIIKYN